MMCNRQIGQDITLLPYIVIIGGNAQVIEFRLFIFTSLISASPITQGHFLYGNYQHLSTPVWLTIGLSVYLVAFVYKR